MSYSKIRRNLTRILRARSRRLIIRFGLPPDTDIPLALGILAKMLGFNEAGNHLLADFAFRRSRELMNQGKIPEAIREARHEASELPYSPVPPSDKRLRRLKAAIEKYRVPPPKSLR